MRVCLDSAAILALFAIAAPTAAQQSVWGQCGGVSWTGPTTCASGSTCVYQNQWYSQCLPSDNAGPTTAAPPPTTTANSGSSSCATAVADGFASLNGGTTGGNGGTVVTVSTQSQLEQYAGASGRYVIKVSGVINISPTGREVTVTSDKTIVGIGSNAEIRGGGLHMDSVRNIIIRNLRIGNTLNDADNDWDAIQIDTSSNIWIDHCHLEAAGDGLLDSRKDTTFLTVSWTIFRNHDKTFGIGWTDNVTAQITIHHNWFDDVNQRNPSADNIRYAHLYNNYLRDVTSYGHYARGATEMRMENCYFDTVRNPVTKDSAARLYATGNIYVSCTGTTASNTGSVFNPSSFYAYSLDSAANVPSVVSSGAGRKSSICPS